MPFDRNLDTVTPGITYKHYKEALVNPDFTAVWGDQYALTMSQAFYTNNRHNVLTTFHGFARSMPLGGSYLLTAGQAVVFEWLEKHWKFDAIDQENMRDEMVPDPATGKMKRLFTDEFINFVANEPLRLTIDAMPEGEIAFPDEPVYRVHGPLWQCLMVEAAILNAMNSQSIFATLASHLVELAEGAPILEFALRRVQSVGGLESSRGAWIGGAPTAKGGGVIGSSNMLAKRLYGIPTSGTMAHAFIMTYENELEAFAEYAKAMPYNGVFLVDTYNTIEGIKRAIATCKKHNIKLKGIRLDSGDMVTLSREAKKLLDEAGFKDTKIIASDGLSYKEITRLKAAKAPIDIYAIGGYLGNSPDQPSLGPVYKLGAVFGGKVTQEEIDVARQLAQSGKAFKMDADFMRKVIKRSEVAGKTSIPGELDVVRYLKEENGVLRFDGDTIISLWDGLKLTSKKNGMGKLSKSVVSVEKDDDTNSKEFPKGTLAYFPLKRMFNGKMVAPKETIHHARARAGVRLAMVEASHKGMPANYPYRMGIEQGLYEERRHMILDIRRTIKTAKPKPKSA